VARLLAEALDGAGLHKEAIALYARRLRLRPDDAQAAERLALLLVEAGEWVAATDVAMASLQRHPNRPGLHLAASRAWLGRGRLPAALDHAQRATEAANQSSDAWLQLGRVLLAQGELALAGQALQKCVALDGQHPEALVELAWVVLQQGDSQQARQLLLRAQKVAPDLPQVWLVLAAVRRHDKDLVGALAALEQAIPLAPRDGRIPLQAADVALELGFAGQAVQHAATARKRLSAQRASDVELADAARFHARTIVVAVIAEALCKRGDKVSAIEAAAAAALTAADLSQYIVEIARLADEASAAIVVARDRCKNPRQPRLETP
jgi:tetratricopeptide (TPR) repeat protein